MKIKKTKFTKYLLKEICEDEIYTKKIYKYDFGIKDNDVVIDIGANVGVFSIFASSQAKNVKVLAFEPVEKNFKELCKNLSDNQSSLVFAREVGVSDFNGFETLYLANNNDGGHSPSKKKLLKEKENKIKKIKIPCVSFNDVIKNKKVNFLKIDCEGNEYKIIKSITKKQFKNIQKIVMEFHDIEGESIWEICKMLDDNNYFVEVQNKKKGYGLLWAHRR